MPELLATYAPKAVIIGLSLANEVNADQKHYEYITDQLEAEQMADGFVSRLRAIADLAAVQNTTNTSRLVVVGGVYPNNGYMPMSVNVLRGVEAQLLNTTGFGHDRRHVVDFLGTMDNGEGHWRDGEWAENAGHPSGIGHQRMANAVPLDWFAPLWGKHTCF